MMNFIRKNPVLAVGVGLPFLLTIFFFLATIIPERIVPPPQYDALFAVNSFGYGEAMQLGEIKFTVADNHLKAYRRYDGKNGSSGHKRLFLLEAKTGSVREISLPVDTVAPAVDEAWHDYAVPATDGLTLSTNEVAPDGYEFRGHGDNNGGAWPLYSSVRDYANISIAKDGRVIVAKMPNIVNSQNLEFLGWVTQKAAS